MKVFVAGAGHSARSNLPQLRLHVDSLPIGRVLDDYIETQVHGPIHLSDDVEKLVADPSFYGRETGDLLQNICERYGIALAWHRGFTLPIDRVPSDFRGPKMIPLARQTGDIANTRHLDAATIGIAAASLHREPERWRQWGSPDEALRRFRQIWHVVVQYGLPAHPNSRS